MPPKAKKKAAPKKKRGMKTEKRNFTFPTHADPRRQIPGTEPYLDDVTRHNAETARAKAEDREPDYDNASSTQGTPLMLTDVVKSQVPGDWEVNPDVELDVSVEEAANTEEAKPHTEVHEFKQNQFNDTCETCGSPRDSSLHRAAV